MKPLLASVAIERLAETDLPRIRALAERIWRTSYAGLLSAGQIEYMLDWMYSPERLLQDFRGGVVFDWPLIDGEPVGFLATRPEADDPTAPAGSTGPALHLHKLYVLPEFQGKGIGSRLLGHAVHRAAEAGCRCIRLRVNKGNHRAIACYRRNGFIQEASVVTDIGGGHVMDDYIMVRLVELGPEADQPAN